MAPNLVYHSLLAPITAGAIAADPNGPLPNIAYRGKGAKCFCEKLKLAEYQTSLALFSTGAIATDSKVSLPAIASVALRDLPAPIRPRPWPANCLNRSISVSFTPFDYYVKSKKGQNVHADDLLWSARGPKERPKARCACADGAV
jgi:hypothetical protein